ncbi:MAG: alcohol dehydrogenase [Deltaproteobacteria bacterium]|jgi:propanol-preferring alcohol dehydrogenase|nr:MAG: alcohol dehydrogenase [Deltaproteobacteria bacterium]
MKAMVISRISSVSENDTPLELVDLPKPSVGKRDILVKVLACGVCHTELDEIEGRATPAFFPVVPGHQVVGRVEEIGEEVRRFKIGDRVGVAWIYSTCGSCEFCVEGKENLCAFFKATGKDANGGYAQYMSVSEDFAYPIPEVYSDVEAAPLLCAGAIGYRSLKLTGLQDGKRLGLTGFGASGHIVLKLVRFYYPTTEVYVFARSEREREFAKELGAVWVGDIEEESPRKLHCIIDTTPVWKPVVESLKNLEPGGRLVVNAIRKEEVDKDCLLKLDYPNHMWLEKEIKTVANVTRKDVEEFLELAARVPIKPEIQEFTLEEANKALKELREKKIRGAKVLRIS